VSETVMTAIQIKGGNPRLREDFIEFFVQRLSVEQCVVHRPCIVDNQNFHLWIEHPFSPYCFNSPRKLPMRHLLGGAERSRLQLKLSERRS